MDNQENFLSLSKLNIQNDATENTFEVDEPEKTKMVTDDSSGEAAVEELSINDLPAEMRMKILQNLDTPSLFVCRLVNREWNEMSSEILLSRPGTEIRFEFSNVSGFQDFTTKNGKRSLQDFVQCFKESKCCALSYFNFVVRNSSGPSTFFDHKDWIEFLSYFKNKSLKLKIYCFNEVQECDSFTSKLKDLLLNKVPRLEEFGINFSSTNNPTHLKLFPTTEEDKNSSSVQLPDLKVIHVDYSSLLTYRGITQDLVIAAVNLKKIQPFLYDDHIYVNAFQFLHSLGKIHCLETAHIHVTSKLLFTVKQMTESGSPPPPFKLKKLRLFMDSILKNPSTWTDATSFISNLFESSKTTLKSLSLPPLGFLHGLQFPTFTNLMELNFIQRLDDESALPDQMFPCGINSADVFPALRILNPKYMKDWSGAFPQQDSIPRLPSMKFLSVIDHGITGNCISKLALMCPNLKNLKVVKSHGETPQLIFLEVGPAIWTHMKQLETLEIDIDVDSPERRAFAMDSCFTGISIQNCQRLYEVTEAAETLKTWKCSFQIPEPILTPEREYPSILDMKDLKKLLINPYLGKMLFRHYFFTERLTWISTEYAFKLMPQLKLTED